MNFNYYSKAALRSLDNAISSANLSPNDFDIIENETTVGLIPDIEIIYKPYDSYYFYASYNKNIRKWIFRYAPDEYSLLEKKIHAETTGDDFNIVLLVFSRWVRFLSNEIRTVNPRNYDRDYKKPKSQEGDVFVYEDVDRKITDDERKNLLTAFTYFEVKLEAEKKEYPDQATQIESLKADIATKKEEIKKSNATINNIRKFLNELLRESIKKYFLEKTFRDQVNQWFVDVFHTVGGYLGKGT